LDYFAFDGPVYAEEELCEGFAIVDEGETELPEEVLRTRERGREIIFVSFGRGVETY